MRHEHFLILKLQKFFTLLIFLVCTIFSISCQKQTVTSFETENEISQIKEIPKDWQKIEKEFFSFSIPPTMKKNDVKGIDSEIMQFENNEMTLDIEYGDYSQDLIPRLRYYEGKKEQTIIADEKIEIVSFDFDKPIFSETKMADNKAQKIEKQYETKIADNKSQKIEKHYVIGLSFPLKAEANSLNRPKISFVAKCKNLESQETAKTIFYSIKFKQK